MSRMQDLRHLVFFVWVHITSKFWSKALLTRNSLEQRQCELEVCVSRHPAFKCFEDRQTYMALFATHGTRRRLWPGLYNLCHPATLNWRTWRMCRTRRTWKTSAIYFTALMSTFEKNHNIRSWRTWFWVSSKEKVKQFVEACWSTLKLLDLILVLSSSQRQQWMEWGNMLSKPGLF